MAQIREFESTTESYFILDGVSYPKVYEAMLDNGYSDTKIKLVGTNRDTTPLVFSTQYTNIRVDGDSFDTALEAISRLNQVVFSKGGGSGTGGATNVITEDSDTVAFTGNGTVGNPLSAESVGGGTTGDYIPLSGTEEGKPVTGDIEFTNNKKILWESKGLIFNFLFSDAFATLSNNYNSRTLRLSSDLISYEDDNNESISVLFYSTEQDYSSIKIQNNNPTNLFRGLVGNIYYGDNYTDNTYIQKLYADKQHSYSTTEIKTGGTWIDGKPIYTITQFTADTPPTMETVFPTEVIGTYTVYKYTKP